jgi:hypothetical protein
VLEVAVAVKSEASIRYHAAVPLVFLGGDDFGPLAGTIRLSERQGRDRLDVKRVGRDPTRCGISVQRIPTANEAAEVLEKRWGKVTENIIVFAI